jgi:hypothetical protein
MEGAFRAELRERGVLAGEGWLAPSAWMDAAELDLACTAVAETLRRMRALLVELNSYLSGGLPWVFPGGHPTLRERGLAVYRYPCRAEVDVEPLGAGVRIAFREGPLGAVTSSGFYVPTRVRGDFRAEVRYELERWQPGERAACVALFVQDEPGVVRHYAQRTSHRGDGDAHAVLANFSDRLGEPYPCRGGAGRFRIERAGRRVRCWHRGADEWRLLGEHEEREAHDVFVGAKIWALEASGGLAARLDGLTIEGEIPTDQPPPVPVRPDPRSC